MRIPLCQTRKGSSFRPSPHTPNAESKHQILIVDPETHLPHPVVLVPGKAHVIEAQPFLMFHLSLSLADGLQIHIYVYIYMYESAGAREWRVGSCTTRRTLHERAGEREKEREIDRERARERAREKGGGRVDLH